MTVPSHPILVVSYVDETRAALSISLGNYGVRTAPCATFCEAENMAREGSFSGLLVDLPSIIKAKGEEKIVAYTLANFFPVLRVRAIGSMLVPMSMPGNAKQDKNLDDFLTKTCQTFTARKLRGFKRHQTCISTLLYCKGESYRGFTRDLSWGGAFIVDVFSERFINETEVSISFIDCGFILDASIHWSKPWGQRTAPGIGVSFNSLDDSVKAVFSGIFKTSYEFDRDRLTA